MSHPTTRRNPHSYMGRPTRRTQQPILIAVAGNQLQHSDEGGRSGGEEPQAHVGARRSRIPWTHANADAAPAPRGGAV